MALLNTIAVIVFWACLLPTLYTYLLYPVCVWLCVHLLRNVPERAMAEPKELPTVTLLVAAHNEEDVIESKIRNSLTFDYPRDRLNIVIGSDGSSDRTGQIVSQFAAQGVRLLDYHQRRGKVAVLNSAVQQTDGEILVLSDANTEFDRLALRRLVRWFADPEIIAVCGRLILLDPADGTNVDGLYWRYETFLKKCEGSLGALLGANGAIYALRRSAYVPVPDNTIIDDFVIPLLSKVRYGGRLVYDAAAVAWEATPPAIGSEFRRRIRIGTGGYQSLTLLWKLLSPRHGWTAFAFFSHKLLRWLVPFLLLGMVISNLVLLNHPFYQLTLAAQVAIFTLSILGMYLHGNGLVLKAMRAATMFFGMNLALLFGFWHWLTSPQTGVWNRTAR
jgi:cellulose synthase/poly-beta-1,6-N-acetylglucosamine synthase-like glycosyltransferase